MIDYLGNFGVKTAKITIACTQKLVDSQKVFVSVIFAIYSTLYWISVITENLIASKNDIAYLSDLFRIFNEVHLQLQGDDLNLFKTKNANTCFCGNTSFQTKSRYR